MDKGLKVLFSNVVAKAKELDIKRRAIIIISILLVVYIAIMASVVGTGIRDVTIIFDTKGGSDIEPVLIDNEYQLPLDLEKEGYSFIGWYETSDYSGDPVLSVSPSRRKNLTLYAKWQVNTYQLEIIGANGANTGYGQYEYLDQVTVEAQANSAYSFMGWYDNSDYEGEPLSTQLSYAFSMPPFNLTLYARYDYTPYDNDLSISVASVVYGEDIAIVVLSNTGGAIITYEFKKKGADDDTYTSTPPAVAGEYTIRATTAPNNLYKASNVTLDFQILKAENDIVIEVADKIYGEDLEIAVIINVSGAEVLIEYKIRGSDASTYTFVKPTQVGLYTVRARSQESANYLLATNTYDFKILKADYDLSDVQWNCIEPFLYDGNQKIAQFENLPESIVIDYLNNKQTGAGIYQVTATFTYDENNYNAPTLDLNATMIIEHRIVFIANGGYGVMEAIGLTTDVGEDLPEYAYSRTGYTFLGWSLNNDIIVDYNDQDFFDDFTYSSYSLYAVWEANSYIITFNHQEADNMQDISAIDVIYDQPMPNIAIIPSKDGFIFDGYDDINKIKYYDNKMQSVRNWNIANNTILYAKWIYSHTPGLIFEEVVDAYKVTGYTGMAQAISIPETYNSMPVIGIGSLAFYQVNNISTIYISSEVKYIESLAFIMSNNLESVHFAQDSKLERIGNNAFNLCQSLDSIIIPASVKSIGDEAFMGCSVLSNLTFENGSVLESIGAQAFIGTMLTSVSLPESLLSVGDSAFMGITQLSMISINEGLCSIGEYAFSETSISDINIPASVDSIGDFFVRNCGLLESINVDPSNNTYKSIDGVLFSHDGLTLIVYPKAKSNAIYSAPETVETIAKSAFEESALVEITLQNNVKFIDIDAFYNCQVLESVYIRGITPYEISSPAFSLPSASLTIYVPYDTLDDYKTTSGWSDVGDRIEGVPVVLFILEGLVRLDTLFVSIGDTIEEPSEPERMDYVFLGWYQDDLFQDEFVFNQSVNQSITYIYAKWQLAYTEGLDFALINDSEYYVTGYSGSIEEVFIPKIYRNKPVVKINDGAFSGNTLITSVEFDQDSHISIIGFQAFYGCINLKNIILPDSLTIMQRQAFYNSGIVTITIPKNLHNIEDLVFTAKNLEEISVDVENAHYKAINGVLFNSDGSILIAYPIGKDKIGYTVPEGVQEISITAFSESRLEIVSLPNTIKEIGIGAFFDCKSLVEINFPEGLLDIELGAFVNTALVSVRIPNSLTNLRYEAFYNCNDLEAVIITNPMPFEIANGVFDGAHANLKIYVYNAYIDDYKFEGNWQNYAHLIERMPMVSFDSNGGDLIAFQEITYGELVLEPSAPTRDDDIFLGWYEDEELYTQFDFNTPITATITLYAKWGVI